MRIEYKYNYWALKILFWKEEKYATTRNEISRSIMFFNL